MIIIKNKVSGATGWTGIDGFGKRRSTLTIEGITMHMPMPMIIEVIDEKSKLEPLLPHLKMMVDDNGIITIHKVDVIWFDCIYN